MTEQKKKPRKTPQTTRKMVKNFEGLLADPKNQSILVQSLEALEQELKKRNTSIVNYPNLIGSIMSSDHLKEKHKLDLVNVFLENGLPHGVKIEGFYRAVSDGPLIHLAVAYNHKKMVNRLIEYGEDLDARTEKNSNALSIAAFLGQEDMFVFLIKKGLRPLDNASLLCACLNSGKESFIKKALKLKADHFKEEPAFEWNDRLMLMLIQAEHSLSVVKEIIHKMTELNHPFDPLKTYTQENLNPLHLLAESAPRTDSSDLALYLLELGVDPLQQNWDLKTPIEHARELQRISLADLMEGWLLAKQEKSELTTLMEGLPKDGQVDHPLGRAKTPKSL